MAKQTKKLPSAVPVAKELIFGGWTTCTVAAAVDLDVFTFIAHGKTTASEIASEAHANESMMRRLLDTLVALKYLTRKGDRYALSRDAATFLVRGGDLYMEGAGRFEGARCGSNALQRARDVPEFRPPTSDRDRP